MDDSIVVFNRESTFIFKTVKSERAAKMAITRLKNNGQADKASMLDYLPRHEFVKIEKSVERINLMTQKPYMEKVNTPASCSPSCETYWAM